MTTALVDALDQTWSATSELLHTLDEPQWSARTGCPAWDVHDVVAHLVWSARLLGGHPAADVELPELDHLTNPVARYMQLDVHARRGVPHAEVLDELDRHRVETIDRLRRLGGDGFDTTFVGPMGGEMSYASYLPIAVLDEWVHGEDVRRAVGAPMEHDTSACTHSIGQLLHVLSAKPFVPCVLRVGPPVDREVVLGDGAPRTTIGLGARDFVARATGRAVDDVGPVDVDGDRTAADAVLRGLVVTP